MAGAGTLLSKAIKHKHSEAEAEVVGRAEANTVAAFIAGLEAKVGLIERSTRSCDQCAAKMRVETNI